ncbi:MAG: gamma-glutamylcyclotransferase [Verrucomicrobia bacterium]|nr:gamma-glutamylcyclotransferase [Verrucomicrobiota bacterium]
MLALVFIYGSLLPNVEGTRHRLLGPSRFVCSARVRGRLFLMWQYPGAVPAPGVDRWVRGEVYEIRDPDHTFKELDRYEGYLPDSPDGCEFRREIVEVVGEEAQQLSAWIYWYAWPTAGFDEIEPGDYRDFLRRHGGGGGRG